MSRSRKKTPYNTDTSQKFLKKVANKRVRRLLKILIIVYLIVHIRKPFNHGIFVTIKITGIALKSSIKKRSLCGDIGELFLIGRMNQNQQGKNVG